MPDYRLPALALEADTVAAFYEASPPGGTCLIAVIFSS
jgi:hypothetical protein